MLYVLCLILLMIGLYGVVTQKNLIKIIISLTIMEFSANMFWIMIGYRHKGVPPIMERGMETGPGWDKFLAQSVDPLPQSLVLTAIVIALAVLALSVAIAMRLYQKYGTYDITVIRRLRG